MGDDVENGVEEKMLVEVEAGGDASRRNNRWETM
jgi:hypothetical protein